MNKDPLRPRIRKALKSFCQKNPLLIEWDVSESAVRISVPNKSLSFCTLFDEIIYKTNNVDPVHEFIRVLENVLDPLYPRLLYRKFTWRLKTIDEMTLSLMRGEDAPHVREEDFSLREEFVITRVDLKRNTFTLRADNGDKMIFRLQRASLFLIKMRSHSESPESLGERFFKKAKKIKTIQGGQG